MTFKTPNVVAQDLLLIHDILGPTYTPAPVKLASDDDICSSDSETDSEDEIAADLVLEPVSIGISHSPLPSELDSLSDSDLNSDSDSAEENNQVLIVSHIAEEDGEEDESGPSAPSKSYFKTKNELDETDVTVPEYQTVGQDEVLEQVGCVLAIVDNVVIVKGLPGYSPNLGNDRALDSETLLVFDDRNVLGYIYETFGPTSQPLYQVKFCQSYPLDREKVRLERPVFHVPHRSRFVFVAKIEKIKGSDASNMHDEEPADHELEWSDDEAEAAFKSGIKKRRSESRGQSVASSRASSPSAYQMRDHDLHFSGKNPYDEHTPYDPGFSGTSRPAPIPYDVDPYSEESSLNGGFTTPSSLGYDYDKRPSLPESASQQRPTFDRLRDRGSQDNREQRRGRGRGRGRGYHPQHVGGREQQRDNANSESCNVSTPFAPAFDGTFPHHLSTMGSPAMHWNFTQGQPFPLPNYQQAFHYPQHFSQPSQSYVQPHINPRFMSAFGMGPGNHDGTMSMPFQNVNLMSAPNHHAQQLNWSHETQEPPGTNPS